jgi:hypothetical protein
VSDKVTMGIKEALAMIARSIQIGKPDNAIALLGDLEPQLVAHLERVDAASADADRLDWLEHNAIESRWDHRTGWRVVCFTASGEGRSVRAAIDDAMRNQGIKPRAPALYASGFVQGDIFAGTGGPTDNLDELLACPATEPGEGIYRLGAHPNDPKVLAYEWKDGRWEPVRARP